MWLLKDNVFINKTKADIDELQTILLNASHNQELTVIIGNGASRSAAYLHNLKTWSNTGISWEQAVVQAAEEVVDKSLYSPKPSNYLALAQAVSLSGSNGRNRLVEAFSDGLSTPIPDTLIHDIIVALDPSAVITTNYDLRLEHAFENGGKNWIAYVRNVSHIKSDLHVPIFKMHGTLTPPPALLHHYRFADPVWEHQPNDSIVVSEADYDQCLDELRRAPADSPLFDALQRTCLFIGKGFYWQDLSFIYALRATRPKRQRAYTLQTDISTEERLNLSNLQIEPLLLNMPAKRTDEHYYVSAVYGLLTLFPHLQSTFQQSIDDFAARQNLFKKPHFVAVGLVAHNTSGKLTYITGDSAAPSVINIMPPPGRHSMAFQDTEEYAGGAALTAAATVAALDKANDYNYSIISVVGHDDIYRQSILKFCEETGLDFDGISSTADMTWRSTILIHDDELDKTVYRGQRAFLDRGFTSELKLSPEAQTQLLKQTDTSQDMLRIFYFDKFMALPYPPKSAQAGVLSNYRTHLETLVYSRPEVDFVYETGSSGSRDTTVELEFAPLINIVTSSFRFFARYVLDEQDRTTIGKQTTLFNSPEWFATTFSDEIPSIHEFLIYIGSGPTTDQVTEIHLDTKWIEASQKWAGRTSQRRWFIATLHHLGALAIDINTHRAWHVPLDIDVSLVQNTAGAGDVFRGAFCYALLRLTDQVQEDVLLRKCLEFAVQISARKCLHFKMSDSFEEFSHIGDELIRELLHA